MGLTAAERDALRVSTNSSLEDPKFSQASRRIYRIFTDQWGREYGADCEMKTQHPCGPFAARFVAPIMPTSKYIVITDTMRGRVVVDTRLWLNDAMESEAMYWEECERWALDIAGVRANELYDVEKRLVDPKLVRIIGRPPMPIEVIQAMRMGNRWILGLPLDDGTPAPKPAAAPRDYFPDASDLRARDPFQEIDPWAGEPTAADPPEENTALPASYPHHYGGGMWWLTDAHRADFEKGLRDGFRGSRVEAERALAQGLVPPLKADEELPEIDPSWGA